MFANAAANMAGGIAAFWLVMFRFGSWTVWDLLLNTLHYRSFGLHQPTYVIIRFTFHWYILVWFIII